MLLVGSDNGVYRIPEYNDHAESTTESAMQTLESGRVMRLRQFDSIDGVFAATTTGLYHSRDGAGMQWTELGVPQEQVYAVGASPSEKRLYAGTRPANVYTATLDDKAKGRLEWTELEGFQDLPSRNEWRLPRHENLAQVRDVHVDAGVSDSDRARVIAGVEVGGVHVCDDGGETWTEQSDGVHNDIHELTVVASGGYVAATGDGLYATTDAGRTWDRLDDALEQSYFRCAFSIGGTIYASVARSSSATWDDEDAAPALVAYRESTLEMIDLPSEDEMVTGMSALDGDLVVATHNGSLFVRRAEGWERAGMFPVSGSLTGRYTPITRIDRGTAASSVPPQA